MSPSSLEGRRRGGRIAPAAALMLGLCTAGLSAEGKEVPLVEFGSAMRYLDNRSAPAVGLEWTAEAFDDSGWMQGVFGAGYEASPPGASALISTPVPSGTLSIYTRARFTVADPSSVRNLFIGADWDDGWIAWINGVEVFRSPQMPSGAPAWNTSATSHESSNGAVPDYGALVDVGPAGLPALHAGTNVLAVGVWNSGGTASSDLVIVPRLVMNRPAVKIVRGPYLQLGTSGSVHVRWRTDVAADSQVRVGRSPRELDRDASDATIRTDHEIVLDALEPATRYYYSVGTTLESIVGEDDDHAFVTAPPPGAAARTRIWVLGDSGTGDANARAVRDAYSAFTGDVPTDLWLMLGDNAYDSGTDSDYQRAVFDTFPSMLRTSVLWSAYGNHDALSADAATQTGVYFDAFSLPSQGEAQGVPSGTEAYYSFDWSNVHFVCLDSSESSRAPDGPMLRWMRDDLAAATADWTVAFWHHPPYTKGSHDSDVESDLIQMRENVLPSLEAAGVDLVLAGHSHSYERSFLIDGHYGPSSTFGSQHVKDGGDGDPGGSGPYLRPSLGPAPHSGAVYAVVGSSGKLGGGPLDHPAMARAQNRLGSLVLDVAGNRLDVAFVDDQGGVLDRFSIVKDASLLPVADFTAEPLSGRAPLTVRFLDRTINGPLAWTWDLDGDGAADSTHRDPTGLYGSPGVYTVRLTVQNVAGTAETVRERYVCVTAEAPPAPVTDLRFEPDGQTMVWSAASGAVYDVAKGDLGALVEAGGDFAGASLGCIAAGAQEPRARDPVTPASGGGFYYLTRAVDCAGRGTYDDAAGPLVGSRDPTIPACP